MNDFSLINEVNERYSLKNLKETAFIPSVGGFGYENNMSYVRVGYSYKLESNEMKQSELSGTVIFSEYAKYQEFINFVEQSKSLRVVYKPIDTEYFRDVDFNGITGVKPKSKTIEGEVKFNCKGLYYTEDNKRFVVEEMAGEARYPILFDASFNDYASVAIDYNNVGHSEGEILTEIYGYCEQPTIELYVNGIVKYKVMFDIVIQEGQKLLYSSKDGDNYVVLEDVDGTQTNIPSCLKLENDNFFKLPKGVSTLKTTSATGVMNKIVFRILTAYKGV